VRPSPVPPPMIYMHEKSCYLRLACDNRSNGWLHEWLLKQIQEVQKGFASLSIGRLAIHKEDAFSRAAFLKLFLSQHLFWSRSPAPLVIG